jgi:pimeloyl-ACP methyl ester carboxylesterase/acyl-CoA thioesterase FadM
VEADAPVEVLVFPDDCDAYGHLNQAGFLRLFERARWSLLARGPGMDLFERHGVWPAVRKATVEFLRQVFPGDVLRFEMEVAAWGETSFTLRQRARKVGDDGFAAESEIVFVTIGRDGRPVPIPLDVARFFGVRASRSTGVSRQYTVRGIAMTADVAGDGPAVLLVHGFPLDRSMWRRVASGLTGWRRIAPDLRGLGLSEAPASGYSMTEYADDLVALLDAVHAESVVLCGFSMGGYVAFEFLRRHPDRVRALVLANTRATPDDAAGREKRNAMIARIRRDGPGFLADDMLPRLLAPTSLATMPDVVRETRAMMGIHTATGLVGALEAMRDRPSAAPLLPTITVPTLVVHGSDDQLIPLEEARAMADAIPGAQLAVIPGAGHLAPVEQPVNSGRVIREFLDALL